MIFRRNSLESLKGKIRVQQREIKRREKGLSPREAILTGGEEEIQHQVLLDLNQKLMNKRGLKRVHSRIE